MYAPINQIQSPDDEDEDPHQHCNNIDSSIKQSVHEHSSLPNYFAQAQDFTMNSHNFEAVKNSWASNPMKISYERLIQEGYDLASPRVKAKKRKAETVDDGGGRVVRAIGRKDRHSKVRTARGPRDRRVRLSPRTAIQFYDVQDRLGYDRPSKAIDWLINEAKTAIDALEEQQPILKFCDSDAAEMPNHGGFSLSQCGKQEHLDDDDGGSSLVSGFGCFVNEAPPSSAAGMEAYLAQDFSSSRNRSEIYPSFCSALNSTPQTLETNWEMARLQKMFTWNSCGDENSGSNIRGGGGGGGAEYSSGNSLPPHAAAQPVSGHLFSQREPLQSSILNHNSPINNDFAGFNFSNELSKIAASATPKHDENLKKLILSLPSTTTSHYQG